MKPSPLVEPQPNTLCMTMDVDCGISDVTAAEGRSIGIEDLYVTPTFDRAIPRYLDLAAEHRMPTTFFVVAGAVTKPEHKAMLRRMAHAGHEIASHTLTHPKNLGHCDADTLRRETVEAKQKLEDAIGVEVAGFRAPGFFMNDRVSTALREAGFRYSSSINGALTYNAMKLLFSLKRKLSGRTSPFYHVEPGALLAPTRPYVQHRTSFWRSAQDGDLVEIPTSTDALRLIAGVTFSLDLMLPGWAWRAFLRHLMTGPSFITIVLHDFEFLRAADFSQGVPLPLTTSLMTGIDPSKNSANYCILAAAARDKRKVLLKALVIPDDAGEPITNARDGQNPERCHDL